MDEENFIENLDPIKCVQYTGNLKNNIMEIY